MVLGYIIKKCVCMYLLYVYTQYILYILTSEGSNAILFNSLN